MSTGEVSRQTDLVLLGNGSVVFAVLSNQNLRLYKVDSHGLPVDSFGTIGQFAYAADFVNAYSIGIPCSLHSLSDSSLLVGIRNAPSGSRSESLLAIRISRNGTLTEANNLLAEQGSSIGILLHCPMPVW